MQSLDTLLKGEMKAKENTWKNTDGFLKEEKYVCMSTIYSRFTRSEVKTYETDIPYSFHVAFGGRTTVLKVSNSFILLHSFPEGVH